MTPDDEIPPQARDEIAPRAREFVTRVAYGLQCPDCEETQTEAFEAQRYVCNWCGHA